MPGRRELPSTLARSPGSAQRTWIKAHDSAVAEYGEGRRAHQVAHGALKHTHEKVGDPGERKESGRKQPSDPRGQAPQRGLAPAAREAREWTSGPAGSTCTGWPSAWRCRAAPG